MNISYAVLSMLAGWCGNEPWQWWRHPVPVPGPIPVYRPHPEPWIFNVISVMGGLGGGVLVTQAFPSEVSLATVSVGAFVAGRVASRAYNIVTNGNETQQSE